MVATQDAMHNEQSAVTLTWDAWWDDHYQADLSYQRKDLLTLRQFPFLSTACPAQRPPKGDWRTRLTRSRSTHSGRVAHVGMFEALEDELCRFGTDGLSGSPDRVDALVCAVSVLMLSPAGAPRIRAL